MKILTLPFFYLMALCGVTNILGAEEVYYANSNESQDAILAVDYITRKSLAESALGYEKAIFDDLKPPQPSKVEVRGVFVISDSYCVVNSALRNTETNETGNLPWYVYSVKTKTIEGGIQAGNPIVEALYLFSNNGIETKKSSINVGDFTSYAIEMPNAQEIVISKNSDKKPIGTTCKLMLRSTSIIPKSERNKLDVSVLAKSEDYKERTIRFALKYGDKYLAVLDDGDKVVISGKTIKSDEDFENKVMLSAINLISYVDVK